jgi:hypothetical protein
MIDSVAKQKLLKHPNRTDGKSVALPATALGAGVEILNIRAIGTVLKSSPIVVRIKTTS